MSNVDLNQQITQEQLKSALIKVAEQDVGGLLQARKSYGDSCLKRGGVGFMMNLFRKTDRLELLADKPARGERYDLFDIIQSDVQADVDGMLDTVRDLRRYLMLAEAHLVARQAKLPESRDNKLAKGGENDITLMQFGMDLGAAEPEVIISVHRFPSPSPGRTGQERPFGFDPQEDAAIGQHLGQVHAGGIDRTADGEFGSAGATAAAEAVKEEGCTAQSLRCGSE